jgi:hypothetical protein
MTRASTSFKLVNGAWRQRDNAYNFCTMMDKQQQHLYVRWMMLIDQVQYLSTGDYKETMNGIWYNVKLSQIFEKSRYVADGFQGKYHQLVKTHG